MGYIEKRTGHYRARYRDPLGRQRSETFIRKADAERSLREGAAGSTPVAPTWPWRPGPRSSSPWPGDCRP
jgi:hypothetical protein